MEKSQNQKSNAEHFTAERPLMTGIFTDRESTERAYNELLQRGYTKDEINLIMSDETRKKYYPGESKEKDKATKTAEGAGAGTAIGGTVGAIAGIVAALGTSFIIPGLGILIAGPIAAGLAGAGAGGIAGGIIGALVGAGIPETRAKLYEKGIKEGHVVIGVHPRNDADTEYIEKSWHTNKAQEIYK